MVHSIMLKKGAGYNLLTVEEYLAIPLNERVDLVLAQKFQFLDVEGNPLPLKEAVKDLSKVEIGNKVRKIA